MRPRSLARRLAFQYLYQVDLNREDCEPPEAFLDVHAEREDVRAFATELIHAWFEHRDNVDACLREHLANYSLERVAAVERSILRLATTEFALRATPDRVVINEAVELAKAFGGQDSGRFVNGILDAARTTAAPSGPPSAERPTP